MEIISIGIDQGIASSGYGVIKVNSKDNIVQNMTLLDYGVIETASKNHMCNRTMVIVDSIKELIEKYKPVIVGCERLFFSQPRKGGRNKSASIVYTNMATGLLYYACGVKKVPLIEFVPGTIKKLVSGKGNAGKDEMIDTISKKFKIDLTSFNGEHMADAVSIAMAAGLYYLKNQEELSEITYCIENNSNLEKMNTLQQKRPLSKKETEILEKMKIVKPLIDKPVDEIVSISGFNKRVVNNIIKNINNGKFELLLSRQNVKRKK